MRKNKINESQLFLSNHPDNTGDYFHDDHRRRWWRAIDSLRICSDSQSQDDRYGAPGIRRHRRHVDRARDVREEAFPSECSEWITNCQQASMRHEEYVANKCSDRTDHRWRRAVADQSLHPHGLHHQDHLERRGGCCRVRLAAANGRVMGKCWQFPRHAMTNHRRNAGHP